MDDNEISYCLVKARLASNPPLANISVLRAFSLVKSVDLIARLRRSHDHTFELYVYTCLNVIIFRLTAVSLKINIPSNGPITMLMVRAIRSRRRCSGKFLDGPMLRRLRELAPNSKYDKHFDLEISVILKILKQVFS